MFRRFFLLSRYSDFFSLFLERSFFRVSHSAVPLFTWTAAQVAETKAKRRFDASFDCQRSMEPPTSHSSHRKRNAPKHKQETKVTKQPNEREWRANRKKKSFFALQQFRDNFCSSLVFFLHLWTEWRYWCRGVVRFRHLLLSCCARFRTYNIRKY